MLDIHKIPVKTPYEVGPVNCYLIKNKPYTLIDPGHNSDAAKNSLIAGLRGLNVEIDDVEQVILTHSHLDHSGLALWVQRLSGAQIYMHHLEMRKLTPGYDFYLERLSFLQEAGLPSDMLYNILHDFDPVEHDELFYEEAAFLNEGDVLTFSDGDMTVKHLPGHSDGHICFFEEDSRRLLAGDFMLKEITPNPNMEPDVNDFTQRQPVLRQYLEALRAAEELHPRIILPGHGDIIEDAMDALKRGRVHHQKRLRLVYNTLKGNNMSVYQLMRVFYPDIKGFEVYLGISEVFAHVDYLVSQGKLFKQAAKAICLYHT